MDLKITPKHIALGLAGWAFALSAVAQWQWIDKDGRKVFSDRPPPADIRDRDILKHPANRAPAPETQNTEAASTPAAAAPGRSGTLKISGKDAELEARKKAVADEAAAKKKAEEEKLALVKAENCSRAKRGLITFQSGARIMTTNAKGEREFMDDKARADESKRLQTIVDRDCV